MENISGRSMTHSTYKNRSQESNLFHDNQRVNVKDRLDRQKYFYSIISGSYIAKELKMDKQTYLVNNQTIKSKTK